MLAQPPDRPGVIPSAEQGAEPMAPEFVQTIGNPAVVCDEDSELADEGEFVSRWYGATCRVYSMWSDPRLKGTETYKVNGAQYMDDSEFYVGHFTHDIVTDVGAWRMRPLFRFDSADGLEGDGPGSFSGTWVLDGDGAYEGLSVVLAKDDKNLSGFIVSTDMLPSAPERSDRE